MLEINNKCNLVWEAYSLLRDLGEGSNPADITRKLAEKYHVEDSSWPMKEKLIGSIYHQMLDKVQGEMDSVSYYFAPLEEDCNCLASMLLPIKLLLLKVETPEGILEGYYQMTKQEKDISFAEELHNVKSLVTDNDGEFVEPANEIELLKEILKMDVQDGSKIKIQELYLNQEGHMERIVDYIRIAMEVIKLHLKEIHQVEKDFQSYWVRFSKEKSIEQVLKDNYGIELMDQPEHKMARPQLMQPSSMYMMSDGKETGLSYWSIYIGILFGDGLKPNMKKPSMTQEEITTCLKLLSDKSKLEILQYIRDDWRYGSEIAKQLQLTTATISYHMGALLNQRMVELRREENKIYYKENKKVMEELIEGVSKLLL